MVRCLNPKKKVELYWPHPQKTCHKHPLTGSEIELPKKNGKEVFPGTAGVVEAEMSESGLNWGVLERKGINRVKWMISVSGLCTQEEHGLNKKMIKCISEIRFFAARTVREYVTPGRCHIDESLN